MVKPVSVHGRHSLEGGRPWPPTNWTTAACGDLECKPTACTHQRAIYRSAFGVKPDHICSGLALPALTPTGHEGEVLAAHEQCKLASILAANLVGYPPETGKMRTSSSIPNRPIRFARVGCSSENIHLRSSKRSGGNRS